MPEQKPSSDEAIESIIEGKKNRISKELLEEKTNETPPAEEAPEIN